MAAKKPQRDDRSHKGESKDQRSQFQRDRDRVLYSSAFQRLAGITQIVKAGEESVFHTRQQHTIKVAQVGRRLAEALTVKKSLRRVLDPDVVEAACLIHDLGHPPFGHAGEKVLDRLVVEGGNSDGFEGNAQSFRIVTKLAVHKEDWTGLNLTRATLAATLKYPWFRGPTGTSEHEKWSAYRSEQEDFTFATNGQPTDTKSIEAEVMDWADDIAYSVHDLEDFHRCSVIPWKGVFSSEGKADLLKHVKQKPGVDLDAAYEALRNAIMPTFGDTLEERYEGTRIQRWVLRNLTSNLINLYISSTSLDVATRPALVVPPNVRGQIDILKQITRDHVIKSPSLAAQQVGYRKIITNLFENFYEHPDGHDDMPPFTPVRLQYLWDLRDNNRARFAADCVAALSEPEAVGMYARLNGFNSGSVLDPIVR